MLCGDLNVAHEEIDLKNPRSNRGNAGFSDQERGKMTELLSSGFTDTFRALYPDRTGAYTWWSYRFNARKNNAGWRIDYFIVSDRLLPGEGQHHPRGGGGQRPLPRGAGAGLIIRNGAAGTPAGPPCRPSLLQPQQHLPAARAKPRPGQGLLKGVAVGAHLHQQRTVGELLVVPRSAWSWAGPGWDRGVHALSWMRQARTGSASSWGVLPLAGAQHQHDLGGVHPVDPGDGLVYRAVLPTRASRWTSSTILM